VKGSSSIKTKGSIGGGGLLVMRGGGKGRRGALNGNLRQEGHCGRERVYKHPAHILQGGHLCEKKEFTWGNDRKGEKRWPKGVPHERPLTEAKLVWCGLCRRNVIIGRNVCWKQDKGREGERTELSGSAKREVQVLSRILGRKWCAGGG